MLLSDAQVAAQVSQNFVLCWNSLRPVPKVTIDFGNGKVLERTIKGNTAFQVCRADGTVVDSLPGVMTPRDFLKELDNSLRLTTLTDDEVLQFHRAPIVAQNPPRPEAIISKGIVEAPLVRALQPSAIGHPTTDGGIVDVSANPATRDEFILKFLPGDQKSIPDRAVALDSRASLTVLRPAVHRLLGDGERLPRVSDFRRSLFKEVLKVDLDDPYLGLKVDDVPGT